MKVLNVGIRFWGFEDLGKIAKSGSCEKFTGMPNHKIKYSKKKKKKKVIIIIKMKTYPRNFQFCHEICAALQNLGYVNMPLLLHIVKKNKLKKYCDTCYLSVFSADIWKKKIIKFRPIRKSETLRKCCQIKSPWKFMNTYIID